jgi:hypothetical protein
LITLRTKFSRMSSLVEMLRLGADALPAADIGHVVI